MGSRLQRKSSCVERTEEVFFEQILILVFYLFANSLRAFENKSNALKCSCNYEHCYAILLCCALFESFSIMGGGRKNRD